MVLLAVSRELGGGGFGHIMKVEELAPYGDESVDFLVNDELFYHAGELTVPARPNSGMDMRRGPSGLGPRAAAKTMTRCTRTTILCREKGTRRVG